MYRSAIDFIDVVLRRIVDEILPVCRPSGPGERTRPLIAANQISERRRHLVLEIMYRKVLAAEKT